MGGNVDYHTHVAGYGLKQLDWWNEHPKSKTNPATRPNC